LLRGLLGRLAGRLEDIPAPAVIGGNRQRQPFIACRFGFRAANEVLNARIELRQVAHDAQADAVGVQLADLALERGHEMPHEERHFFHGPAPVFGAEREKRQIFDARARARLDGRTHRIDAARMARYARQTSLRRPAAVAVHDDRDVARNGCDIGYANS